MVFRLVAYLGGRASISLNRLFASFTIFIFHFHMLRQKISFSRGFMGFDFQAHRITSQLPPHPCFKIDYQQAICLSYCSWCTFLHWFTTYFGKFGVMLPLFCFIHFFFGQFILTSKARWRKKLHNLVCSSIMVTRFICLLCGMILASQILLFMTKNRKFKLIYHILCLFLNRRLIYCWLNGWRIWRRYFMVTLLLMMLLCFLKLSRMSCKM